MKTKNMKTKKEDCPALFVLSPFAILPVFPYQFVRLID